jgi:phosphatidylglycerophosphate synthase
MPVPAASRAPAGDARAMIPNLISLARLPLAVAFIYYAAHPVASVAIVCLGGVSDWLDGWLAKRLGQRTAAGALLDPICDHTFTGTVLVTLVVLHGLPVWQLAVLIARDVVNGLGGAAVWLLRPELVGGLRPLRAGKIVTSLQFWFVVHFLLGLPLLELSLAAVAGATGWSIVAYFAQFRRLLGVSNSVSTP